MDGVWIWAELSDSKPPHPHQEAQWYLAGLGVSSLHGLKMRHPWVVSIVARQALHTWTSSSDYRDGSYC